MRTLITVAYDVRYFICLIFFFTLSLSFSGYVLQNEYSKNRFSMFNTFYRINMGDFDQFDDAEIKDHWIASFVYFFLFYFSTMSMTIVMMNMLISIISESYAKIIALGPLTSIYEKAQLLLEIEEKMSDKEKLSNSCNGYLMIIETREDEKTILDKLEDGDIYLSLIHI
eukprot:TRINITY_DN2752_c0_g1_i2.p2 TRINITY_DN2752_c0_g1~~TRINITY_DN2752_c0_g1_i2.p2  ORF type:complete len:169 (-),score=29.28 TRINITY_DN2752_c0_g1_i2:135-641(-)